MLGAEPADHKVALNVAEILGISSLVDRLVLAGRHFDPDGAMSRTIVSHTLRGNQVIDAWARGYSLVFDGVVNFYTDPDVFLAALRNGLPVLSLTIKPDGGLTQEHVSLCTRLEVLKASDCSQIKTCPGTLLELDASEKCGIADISHCKRLRKLIATRNMLITRVPKSVVDLEVQFSSGITKITHCTKMRRLLADGNREIKSCPRSIEELSATSDCGISSLKGLRRLKSLIAGGNQKITRCPKSVVRLDASGDCGITDLSNCVNLKSLGLFGRSVEVRGIPTTLESLDITYCSGWSLDLTNFTCLKRLIADDQTVADFCPRSVTHLEISGQTEITSTALLGCDKLEKLAARNNTSLMYVPRGLVELDISDSTPVHDLRELTSLRILIARRNPHLRYFPTGLVELDIAGASVSVLNLHECRMLRKLDISFTSHISSVPDFIEELSILRCSGISDVSHLRNLKKLIVGETIREIPSWIEDLDLKEGFLVTDISNCRMLRSLVTPSAIAVPRDAPIVRLSVFAGRADFIPPTVEYFKGEASLAMVTRCVELIEWKH